MKAEIRLFNAAGEYYLDEGCYIIELSNQSSDPALSIARARVCPGVTTQWHRLIGTAERYVILEGEGKVELDGLEPKTVSPGDTVIIPPECPQRITNTGNSDLIFLALCTPRFDPGNYRTVESVQSN